MQHSWLDRNFFSSAVSFFVSGHANQAPAYQQYQMLRSYAIDNRPSGNKIAGYGASDWELVCKYYKA